MRFENKAKKRNTRPTKQDIYEKVTNTILEKLESGTVPWRTPHFAKVGFPKNFQSERDYRGINVLMLGMAGYVAPWFMTFLQAKEAGGNIKKGEKGHLVVKYGDFKKKVEDQKSGEEVEESRKYLKGYTVFNACQIEGVEFPELKKPEFTPSQQVEKALAIVKGMPNAPEIREGRGVRSCYWIQKDVIDLPDRAFFESEERFYQTIFHELIHSVGAKHRLNRPSLIRNLGREGSAAKVYEREELVAEIGASFLMAHAGIVIEEHDQNAAYLEGWLQALKAKDHKKWIVEAAGQAQKAVDYILGTQSKKVSK